jgi:DNA polymerase-1
MSQPHFPDGVWAVDFEFHPADGHEGNLPKPVCMVARDLTANRTLRVWQDELETMRQAPFPVGDDALFIAYFASAEMACFLALGWPLPVNVLDLFTEFRRSTNGSAPANGNGLLGALLHYGLPSIAGEEKDAMRDLILRRGPWTAAERADILNYCESDVDALANLLPAMSDQIDWQRALLRGRYMQSVASIEFNGVPIDLALHTKLVRAWPVIKDQLISEVDQNFGVYENESFKAIKFEHYLIREGIPWPRLPSGVLELKDDTFRDMARSYPQLAPLKDLRATLGQMRLSRLTVGTDGRNRCMLSPFRSKTGRNQPSNARFIFGPSAWLRGLIRPERGWGLAYIDWSQQEFGIAAALSEDENMLDAYRSGDPYMAFAKQAGAVPSDATKQSHKAEREQFKACVLAVQYGMGAESLALHINRPSARARQLLDLHRRTYRKFWAFSDNIVNEAVLGGRLWTAFGWQLHTSADPNDRSLRNFPMQANGAEMLRVACIMLQDAGIRICAPVHDALLIEAPLDQLEAIVAQAQDLMRQASKVVLGGFELSSDAKIVQYPDRYMDERGTGMWNTVMALIGEPLYPPTLAA